MAVYRIAPEDVQDLMADVMERYHGELRDAEVNVGIQFASLSMDEEKAVAIMDNGYPLVAKVEKVPYGWRVWRVPDAIITIDERAWENMARETQVALLDRELEHLELARDADAQIKSDDHGRPKLNIKPCDYRISGFASVIRRHGPSAVEAEQFRQVAADYFQLIFDWPEDGDGIPIPRGGVAAGA
jgi:Putative phage metallopeptidase